MGAICSKSGALEGGHKVIGTTQTLGDTGAGGEGHSQANPRLAALKAAEERKRAVSFLLVTRRRWPLTRLDLWFFSIAPAEGDACKQSERRETL